jgi:sugar phosphate isomerase/epimerase
MENSINSLKILSEEVRKVDGQLAVECLPRTCLGNTADELLKIVNSVNNGLGICFDTNHLLKEKPEEFAEKAGSLIVTLHVSDYDGIDERHWLPGMGIINWTNVVAELAKSGYSGPFMFEASRRKPASDGTADPSKLTTQELYESFNVIKNNFRLSLQD